MARIAKAMSWAEEKGRSRGLRGSSSAWLAIWVLSVGYRYVKRIAAPDPVVVRERLEPGEQLVITHFPKGEEGVDPRAGERRKTRRR